jgi:hypothetical protein
MGKYLETKPNSLESAVLEAVSPAQQAAIAIAKKEKGEKPKNEEKMECPKCKGEGCDHCDGKGYHMMDEKAKFSDKEVKMAIGIASDKRYAGGNYSGAVKTIEKIKKGLSDHPQVKAVLKRQNEDKTETDEELTAKQKKIDLNKNGKVDGDDLAQLRKKADKKEVKEELSLAELAAKHISDMWKEASKSKSEEKHDDKKDKKEDKTTMTGKPMSKVEVSPKDEKKD